jgi:hypothetical protein
MVVRCVVRRTGWWEDSAVDREDIVNEIAGAF